MKKTKIESWKPGENILKVEVTNISEHGFWLFIENAEKFVPFNAFPWFEEASIKELKEVELQGPDHLYWPLLDIDLSVKSIEDPTRFPLMSKLGINRLETVGS